MDHKKALLRPRHLLVLVDEIRPISDGLQYGGAVLLEQRSNVARRQFVHVAGAGTLQMRLDAIGDEFQARHNEHFDHFGAQFDEAGDRAVERRQLRFVVGERIAEQSGDARL